MSNLLTVIVTLGAMFALEWRLTLLALVVLPAFVIPAKRVGRGLQKITREAFHNVSYFAGSLDEARAALKP